MIFRSIFLVALVLTSHKVAWSQGYPRNESAGHMTLSSGLAVDLIASEPLVRQPVCIEFDDRGRLWVIQYLQYPNPEGLERSQVDRFSRTTYDRIPEPPPRGPRGADRITILSDTDGDGLMDSGQDFVNGLNLTSGMARGHGGVFVLNVPYLLFYPDRDRDDVPDSDPEVLLSGFGMQDAHSVANSLTWGPDGWLYGCQGSTVTANIRGIEFQQGVWRYHPRTKAFELFCEGGGNAWGLDFDADGHMLYSTNYGGFVLVHGVQGGNYVKSFAKHGALHNPFTYGYFEHAAHKEFRGGHVTVGGIVYQGAALPESFTGQYVAGDLLGHAAYEHRLVATGSTFRTETVAQILDSHDNWFAPTDVMTGPDGCIYLADWHDARTAHPDPDAQWDRSNGRIYRIRSQQKPASVAVDFAKLTIGELTQMHANKNQWFVRRARAELVRRNATELLPELLETTLKAADAATAREAFWSYLSLQNPTAEGSQSLIANASKLLHSPYAVIRRWTVRWLGDCGRLTVDLAHQLDELAEQEVDVHVRSQLAASAARWPADQALPIINANINRDIDNADPFLPLQWWWAVERHSLAGRDEVMKRFVRPSLWKSKLGRDTLLVRLIRRYAAEGTVAGLDCVLKLLQATPDDAARQALWPAVLAGWQEVPSNERTARDLVASTHPLTGYVQSQWSCLAPSAKHSLGEEALVRLSVLLGNRQPIQAALMLSRDAQASTVDRVKALSLLAEHADATGLKPVLSLFQSAEAAEPIRLAALRVLGRSDDPSIGEAIVSELKSSSTQPTPAMLSLEQELLFSRRDWALGWLAAVERGEVNRELVTIEQVRRLALLDDEVINKLVTKHWGKLSAASPEVKLAEVRRMNNDLRAATGDAKVGQLLFKKHCAACHRLFGEGAIVGPDLTSANRRDRDFLLVSLVDPSSVIRKEYVSVIVQTEDGRVFTGVAVPQAGNGLKLVNSKGEVIELAANEIDQVRPSDVSVMPDDLYKQLSPQDLRDLFAYLSQ